MSTKKLHLIHISIIIGGQEVFLWTSYIEISGKDGLK